jgi:hypothetical protein
MTANHRYEGFLRPDDPLWGAVLAGIPHDFFHLPAYVASCAAHEGGEPLLFLADAGDRGLAVPLVRRTLAEFGPAYAHHSDVRSPYGYPAPLWWGPSGPERTAELMGCFEDHLRNLGVVSLFLRLNPFLPGPDAELAALGDLRVHGPVVYLDLRDPEGSWDGISSQNRRFIKAALAAGCTVRHDAWETLDQVLEAYHHTMGRLGASPFYFFRRDFFLRLRDGGQGHFHLATAFDPDGEVAGGMFFTEQGGLVHAFLCGVRDGWEHLSPAKLLNDALRLWGIRHGFHTLNLGGGVGSLEDGVLQFKLRFSKRTRDYATFRKVLLPGVYRRLSEGFEPGPAEFFPAYRNPAATVLHPAGSGA